MTVTLAVPELFEHKFITLDVVVSYGVLHDIYNVIVTMLYDAWPLLYSLHCSWAYEVMNMMVTLV